MNEIIVDVNSSVTTLTINRETAGNMLNLEMIHELTTRILEAGNSSHCVVLKGSGPDFCRGRDPATAGPHPTPMAIRNNLISPIMGLYDAIRFTKVPVICCVQGKALGLGCAIAGVSDITIAEDTAQFQLPEMEYNLPPTLAISAIMEKVGRKAAAWMTYSINLIAAPRAQEMGLVSQVVQKGSLGSELEKLLSTLTSRDLMAVMAIKEYLSYAPDSGPAMRPMASNLLALALSTQQANKKS